MRPLKREKRERKDSRRVEVKKKYLAGGDRRFISCGGRNSILLEGTQAMPARPPDTNRMKLKTLGWRIGKD
jgi:hypothetical protein